MRKDEGTTPLEAPERTASVRMSARSVPPTSPRSDVVTHTARARAQWEGWGLGALSREGAAARPPAAHCARSRRSPHFAPAPPPRALLTALVVAAARVEAHDERGRADLVLEAGHE